VTTRIVLNVGPSRQSSSVSSPPVRLTISLSSIPPSLPWTTCGLCLLSVSIRCVTLVNIRGLVLTPSRAMVLDNISHASLAIPPTSFCCGWLREMRGDGSCLGDFVCVDTLLRSCHLLPLSRNEMLSSKVTHLHSLDILGAYYVILRRSTLDVGILDYLFSLFSSKDVNATRFDGHCRLAIGRE
jgi:hypothetical protein